MFKIKVKEVSVIGRNVIGAAAEARVGIIGGCCATIRRSALIMHQPLHTTTPHLSEARMPNPHKVFTEHTPHPASSKSDEAAVV